MSQFNEMTPEKQAQEIQRYREAIEEFGGIRPAARKLGIAESTIRTRMTSFEEPVFTAHNAPEPVPYRPYPDRTRYFILTAAQDGTTPHKSFLKALENYAAWLGDCELMISGFTYNKSLFENHDSLAADVHFAKELEPYIIHDRILIGNDADGVEFCGEMNTLPTAVKPLSGFHTYTRHRWGVFPHTKVHLESVATAKMSRSKQIMTTGAVTMPNYIRKKAGLKAAFHHVIGAVLVELLPDGSTFCRHLLASDLKDGTFYDLHRKIGPRSVSKNHRAEALVYGDIHHEKIDPIVAKATWGYTPGEGKTKGYRSLQSFLRPKFELFHDLSDFTPRNHHNIKDPHFRFSNHIAGRACDNVESALMGCAYFLDQIKRDGTQQVIIQSNHDNALLKWLKTADYREDPENALFFLKCQHWYYSALARGVDDPPVFEMVLRENGAPDAARFVDEDSSFIICGDIECGMHGHLGANGSRGNVNHYVKSGMKSNTGHTHSPTILDGAYVAGVSGSLDMGYNKGMSSWAHAHILTYENGKRTILTMCNGRFYADDIDHRRLL